MASDRQQFNRAANKYEELLSNNELSVPDEPGTTHAILVPHIFKAGYSPTAENDPDPRRKYDAYEYFEAEGYALEAQIAQSDRVPDLRLRASVDDFWEVLNDRQVTRLTISALGSFTSALVAHYDDDRLKDLPSNRKNPDGWLRWNDLAFMADHLKQGPVDLRICGRLKDRVNVPLAWGIVNNHSHILAPVGEDVFPIDLEHEDNLKYKPITELSFLGYNAIKSEFPRREYRRDHGPVINALPRSVFEIGATAYRALNRVAAATHLNQGSGGS